MFLRAGDSALVNAAQVQAFNDVEDLQGDHSKMDAADTLSCL